MKNDFIGTRMVLGAVLKTNLELKKLLAELLERPDFNKNWLTAKDLKDEFGISEKLLTSYRLKGLKVIQKVPNGKRFVTRSELDRFLLKR